MQFTVLTWLKAGHLSCDLLYLSHDWQSHTHSTHCNLIGGRERSVVLLRRPGPESATSVSEVLGTLTAVQLLRVCGHYIIMTS